MSGTGSIADILSGIRSGGRSMQVVRERCDLDPAEEMQVVREIGLARSPGFRIDWQNEDAYRTVLLWMLGHDGATCTDPWTRKPCPVRLDAGIYLCGNTGTGKTWLLETMNEYARVRGLKVTCRGKVRPLAWPSVRTDRICDHYSAGGDMSFSTVWATVCFDDLGAEPVESMCMGNRMQVMRSVIERRADYGGLLTLVTSNMQPASSQFTDRYGERVQSRICSMCNYIELVGEDRRKMR